MAQKQPFLERVRNSSLVEQLCADNETGLSMAPKPRARSVELRAVGEHSADLRRRTREGRWRKRKRECRHK